MNNYGKTDILGAASVLPATSASVLLLTSHADPFVVAGLLGVSIVSMIVLIGSISRYLVNSKRK